MNNIESLTDFLFEEMERLNDIDLEEGDYEKLDAEINRAKQLGNVANTIVSAGRAALDAEKFRAEYTGMQITIPKMLKE